MRPSRLVARLVEGQAHACLIAYTEGTLRHGSTPTTAPMTALSNGQTIASSVDAIASPLEVGPTASGETSSRPLDGIVSA